MTFGVMSMLAHASAGLREEASAQLARLDDLCRSSVVVPTPLLGTDLHDAVVCSRGLDRCPTFADGST